MAQAKLILADGTTVPGEPFGAPVTVSGEVVFNTGVVGYPEAITDPSYAGQILVLTYPLIGNYGIPVNYDAPPGSDTGSGPFALESNRIQVSGLVISTLSHYYSHWSAVESLDSWFKRSGVPALAGVDTRSLTKRLRSRGTMLGKLVHGAGEVRWADPNRRNLVADVSVDHPRRYAVQGARRVILVDLGCKESIIRCLLSRRLDVLRVPWNFDWAREPADGVVLSNGPGDPKMCVKSLEVLRRGLNRNIPILGICLGHQLIALASGGDTFKMKFGHRSQNQPCLEVGSRRCFMTSQNHGFAVREESLNGDWKPWFFNANDGTNEGLRHRSRPILSVQFHPEACPGPVDTRFVFDEFAALVNHGG